MCYFDFYILNYTNLKIIKKLNIMKNGSNKIPLDYIFSYTLAVIYKLK